MSQQRFLPTAGTAIAAAVIGCLIAMSHLVDAFVYLVPLVIDGGSPEYVVGLLWNGSLTAILVVGGILLLLRKNSGRVLLVAGTVLSLLAELFVPAAARVYFFADAIADTKASSDIGSLGTFAMALAVLVLALIRPTSDWLEGKPKDDEEPSKHDRLPGW
ncbi:hypothetical protein [Amycolatopsis sp. NPDC051071]|uniref:hypothetical protein n=1 Tax=Amycolatopsis sp. NPDC051071 TaxID=3154637 RepID=UPI0034411AFC